MSPGATRVLHALRKHRDRGITRIDFQAPTIDDGPPVLNFPARILDIKSEGFHITEADERRNRCKVYLLRDEPTATNGWMCRACGRNQIGRRFTCHEVVASVVLDYTRAHEGQVAA